MDNKMLLRDKGIYASLPNLHKSEQEEEEPQNFVKEHPIRFRDLVNKFEGPSRKNETKEFSNTSLQSISRNNMTTPADDLLKKNAFSSLSQKNATESVGIYASLPNLYESEQEEEEPQNFVRELVYKFEVPSRKNETKEFSNTSLQSISRNNMTTAADDLLKKNAISSLSQKNTTESVDKYEEEEGETQRILGILLKSFDDLQKQIDKNMEKKDEFLRKIDQIEEEEKKIHPILDFLRKKFDDLQERMAQTTMTTLLLDDWRKEGFQAVNVTLDADTAHPALCLSGQGRRVTWQERHQDLPSSSQRFNTLPCVLGHPQISSGRYFWEVEVGETGSWDLGICKDNVTRNGRVTMSPQNGFWVIRLYDGEYWAMTSPESPLSLGKKPRIVGIRLDYQAGYVSFYNMTNKSHIFTFADNKFNGDPIRPLFRLWSTESGPLTIVKEN